ncbi:MAG: hypothetical protein RI911_465, partial [Candidatus Parcubacteria bacterium]|jgi:hypothetical protein
VQPNAVQDIATPDVFTLSNIRNITYRGEEFANYTTEWLQQKYDIRDLQKVWFIENNYASLQSHIMLTFEFSGSRFLSVSVEVRKENAQDFEVWHVLYKNFYVFYILATEYDIVYLRTNIRKSPTYRYELNLTPDQQKALFKSICSSMQATYDNNLLYKVFRSDCVTTLLKNFLAAGIPVKKHFWDWSPTRVLYRSGLIKGEWKSLDEVYERTLINEKVASSKQNNEYSLSASTS